MCSMRTRRGKAGAPPCVSVNDLGDVTVHHQWHARNVYGFIIKWYVCEFCGMVMHQLPTLVGMNNVDYEFISAYVIEERESQHERL